MHLNEVVSTGLQSMDQILAGGFHCGSLNIIAARPGMGKSTLALQLAINMAKSHGKTVCFFSFEMSMGQLNLRLKELIGKETEISELPISLDAPCWITPNLIHEKLSNIQNLGAVILDYVQLIRHDEAHIQGWQKQNLCEIIRELKQIAKEFRIIVIGISQLPRTTEDRRDHHPTINDFLCMDNAMEQYADTVLLLYRDAYYNHTADRSSMEIVVAKNRYGKTGTLKFCWNEIYPLIPMAWYRQSPFQTP